MKRVKRTVWPGLGTVLLVLIAVPQAQPAGDLVWHKYLRICWDDFIRIPVPPLEPIPVGCEIIDCCPGCPGPGVIDWRIRVEGNPVEALEVTFENLPGDRAGQLKFEGNVKADGVRLLIGKGEALIRGLPGAGRPAVARLRLVPDKAWASKEQAGARDEAAATRDAG